MYDIQQEFEKIAKGIPQFGISQKIERDIENCVWDAVSDLTKGNKVIIRGGGDHTEKLLEVIWRKYSGKDFDIAAIVDDGMQGKCIAGIPVISREQGEKINYDMVILSSFAFASEMRSDYDESKVKVWDLYYEIDKLGYRLTAPFYYYRKGYYEIPLYYMEAYEAEQTKENLEILIDSLLVLKDFRTVFHYIAEYTDKGFDTEDRYKRLEKNLKKMLETTKKEMIEREDKDIVMFWIDAVPYAKLSNLPFLSSKKEKACFFEKAYTTTPYTHPAMHALFQGRLRIEDYHVTDSEIDETNSEVIRDLQNAGYGFLHIGYCGDKHFAEKFRLVDESYVGDTGREISACMIYWELLCRLLKTEKPMFYIAHTIAETHEPCMALSVKGNRTYKLSESIKLQQYKKTYSYFNDQLQFYSGLLPVGMKKIYMSDHGTNVELDTWQFMEQRIHTVFMIEGKKVPVKEIKGVFSYINFKYIVKYLLDGKQEDLNKAVTEYSLIEDVDKYNIKAVNYLVKKGGVKYGMSFRGVVTAVDKYIRLANGMEFYYMLPDESENLFYDNSFADRIAALSDIAGNIFLDTDKYPEFRHAKMLYEDT